MAHPYQQFEGTELWQALDEAVSALEANGDLSVSTARHLVVGFLAQAAARTGLQVLSEAEFAGVQNALNEVCYGLHIDEAEFQSRLGLERAELQEALKKISRRNA